MHSACPKACKTRDTKEGKKEVKKCKVEEAWVEEEDVTATTTGWTVMEEAEKRKKDFETPELKAAREVLKEREKERVRECKSGTHSK
jgi:hypothetical protein